MEPSTLPVELLNDVIEPVMFAHIARGRGGGGRRTYYINIYTGMIIPEDCAAWHY